MAKKKTARKVTKKTARKAKTVKKGTAKKTTKKQQAVAKTIAWWFFGKLLLLAVVLYGFLYMMFTDFKQGSAIILGAIAVWLLITIIKYIRRHK